ncbi:MAG: hypothetical protein HWD60_07620 [Defluviicoccus sp.]|nr:MAG: hypothetical protein HWD60_07620 [Defluviicoccus sp.]
MLIWRSLDTKRLASLVMHARRAIPGAMSRRSRRGSVPEVAQNTEGTGSNAGSDEMTSRKSASLRQE